MTDLEQYDSGFAAGHQAVSTNTAAAVAKMLHACSQPFVSPYAKGFIAGVRCAQDVKAQDSRKCPHCQGTGRKPTPSTSIISGDQS